MEWMRNNDLPSWAYFVGSLLLTIGIWINVLSKNLLVGVLLMCVGSWLMRWWFEVPADHKKKKKISEKRFRFCQGAALTCSWGMLILTVAVVCLYVFGVLS